MAKEEPIAKCDCREEPVRLPKYIKYSENGEFKYYVGPCPNCGARIKAYQKVPEGHTKWEPQVPVRSRRDRPQVIPADLLAKLEEEKRLREERNGTSEVDSESTAVDDTGERQPFPEDGQA